MRHTLGITQTDYSRSVIHHVLDSVAAFLQYAETLVHIGEKLQTVRGETDLLLLFLEEFDS